MISRSSDRDLETISLSDVHAKEEAHQHASEEDGEVVTVSLYHSSTPAGGVVEIDGSIGDDHRGFISWLWACLGCRCRSRTRSGSHRLINEDRKKDALTAEGESSVGHSHEVAYTRSGKATNFGITKQP